MTLEKQLEAYIDSLGLRYFKGAELTPYWSRSRKNGSNSVPPKNLWPNIVETIIVLDEIRHQVGSSLIITSSYRSPEYNTAVGGAKFSQHLIFNAIDLQSKGGKVRPAQIAFIARRIRSEKQQFVNPITKKRFTFKGGVGLYATFVHIDTRGHNADW
jgi:uncharacterized protein YcbK (DUF882 family)